MKNFLPKGAANVFLIEGALACAIVGSMQPRFSELSKVRIAREEFGEFEGYVIARQFRDGRWIYKVSISEDPRKQESFDNWVPEAWLEVIR